MGVAVLQGGELVYWGVTGFRMPAEETVVAAVAARVRNLVAIYQPEVLAVEAPLPTRLQASQLLGPVVAVLEELAREAELVFKSVDPAVVRRRLCGAARATHADLVDRVVQEYAHLGRYRDSGSAWREAYWRPMFSAVAVALVCVS